MKLMVIGASKGLGRAFVEGLCVPGDSVTGVSRRRPDDLVLPQQVTLDWIEADLSQPLPALQQLTQQAPSALDVLICNLGIWEATAFSDDYDFLSQDPAQLADLVNTNLTSTLLLLQLLVPRLLTSHKPRLLLTGSTSGLPGSGRPEVAFGATKFALSGIADALRENYRGQNLGVTCLQLGYLNTDHDLRVPLSQAAAHGDGALIPLHDVVQLVQSLLALSPASYVRELVLPAIADPRF